MCADISATERNSSKFYGAICLLLIAGIYLRRISGSLWLDETLTYWTCNAGFNEAVRRSIEWSGQSPFYYFIPTLLIGLGIDSEAALRLPSLFLILVSCWPVFDIARRLHSREAGWHAVIFYLATDGAIFSGVSARPYALALCMGNFSVYFLIRYLEPRSRLFYADISLLFFVLLFYSHYLCGTLAVLYAAALIFSRLERRRRIWLACVIAGYMVLTIPGAFQLRDLARRQHDLSMAGSPDPLSLVGAWLPPVILIFFCIAALYAKGMCPSDKNEEAPSTESAEETTHVLFQWHLLPPVFLFFFSHYLKSSTLFVARYYLHYSAALPILLTRYSISFERENTRRFLAGSFVALILCAEMVRPMFTEDWRSIAEIAKREIREGEAFLYVSGLVESKRVATRELTDEEISYLSAPLTYYGVGGRPIFLPYVLTGTEFEEFWKKSVETQIANLTSFAALGSDAVVSGDAPPSQLLARYLKQSGFEDLKTFRAKKNWLIVAKR